jgi:hypothetical protein
VLVAAERNAVVNRIILALHFMIDPDASGCVPGPPLQGMRGPSCAGSTQPKRFGFEKTSRERNCAGAVPAPVSSGSPAPIQILPATRVTAGAILIRHSAAMAANWSKCM